MSYYQFRGAIGELRTIETLLSFGMSVNSLNGSDFGLDVHAQLPAGADFLEGSPEAEPGQPEPVWEMSNRTVHFQVKSLNAGKKLQLPLATLANWVSASRVGNPTFLVVNTYGSLTEEPLGSRMVTPFAMAKILRSAKAGVKSRSVRYDNHESSTAFGADGDTRRSLWARIDLWSAAPALMSAAEDLIPLYDDYRSGLYAGPGGVPNGIQHFDERVIFLVADLAHSYLAYFEPQKLNDRSRILEILELIGVSYARHAPLWNYDQSVSEWGEKRVLKIIAAGGSTLRIPPGSFTAATNATAALEDLLRLAEKLGSYSPKRDRRHFAQSLGAISKAE